MALYFTTGTLIELEAEVKSSSKSAKSSPASLRKQVTVAEGEKASAAAIGAAVSSLSGQYVEKFQLLGFHTVKKLSIVLHYISLKGLPKLTSFLFT